MTIISSGIYPIDPTITDGTQLAGYINELVEAINSQSSVINKTAYDHKRWVMDKDPDR